MEAIAFSTWKEIVPLRVIGMPASGTRNSALGRHDVAAVDEHHLAALHPVGGEHVVVGVGAKNSTEPGQAPAILTTIGSAALSTAVPWGATFCTITRFTTARSSTVLM
jgi:hypothetical protein